MPHWHYSARQIWTLLLLHPARLLGSRCHQTHQNESRLPGLARAQKGLSFHEEGDQQCLRSIARQSVRPALQLFGHQQRDQGRSSPRRHPIWTQLERRGRECHQPCCCPLQRQSARQIARPVQQLALPPRKGHSSLRPHQTGTLRWQRGPVCHLEARCLPQTLTSHQTARPVQQLLWQRQKGLTVHHWPLRRQLLKRLRLHVARLRKCLHCPPSRFQLLTWKTPLEPCALRRP